MARRQTQNPEAYNLYLRGRHYNNQMTPATLARGLDCFRQATNVDPTYGLAWAGIADSFSSRLFSTDTRPSDVSDQARAAAEQALKYCATSPDVCKSAALIQFLFDWDWPAAEKNLRRAIALDPSFVHSYWLLAHILTLQARHDEAMVEAQHAREIDPLNPLIHSMSAHVAFCAREYDTAARYAREALLAEPDYWIGYLQLGQACQQMGHTEQTLEALAEASRLSNQNSKPVSLSAYILALSRRTSEARELLANLEQLSQTRYVPPYAIALVYSALNDDDTAFQWLERALAERDVHLIYLPFDSKWDRLRDDPRLLDFLHRCGFITARSAQQAAV
jgi:tetratricopeptide (TPR) repeat protein